MVLSNSATDINTVGYEDSPFLSDDGRALYFMYTPWTVWPTFYGQSPVVVGPPRLGHHVNADGNPWEDSDIYVAWRQEDGRWGTPENLAFNDPQADCCLMTWDHQEFFYQRTQFPNAARTDLYSVARAGDGTWQRRSLGALVNLPDSAEQNPHVTADGRTLYFTSDRAGGQGGTDLYVSQRQPDGTWGAVAPLPAFINTPANEDQVWVPRDGQTLYFNREPGPRIMASTLTPSGWSAPVMVRFGGQSPDAAEVSGTADGTRLVFAVVRPEVEDIVFVTSLRQANGSWGTPMQLDTIPAPSTPTGLRVRP